MRPLPMLLLALAGGDWPQWRGPFFRSSAEAERLPVEWSAERNVAWSAALPGPAAATPAVAAGRVFVSSVDRANADLVALCLDRASGAPLWSRVVAKGKGRLPNPRDPRGEGNVNTLAAPSPVTDGETVCFLYGTGDLVAFDVGGEELWRRSLAPESGAFEIEHGYASSPLLFDGKLFAQAIHRGESLLVALEPRSGDQLWKRLRDTKAKKGSREAYTSPVPFRNGERWEILVLGADCLTAHDPETGAETWRWRGLNPRRKTHMPAISSAVAGDDGLIVVTAPQHGPMFGLRVAGDEVEELWKLKRPTPGNTTPLLYRDRLYAIDGRNARAVCLDPATGKVLWREDLKLRSTVLASPTAGDGKVFAMDSSGSAVVLAAGDEYRELARNRLDSSPTRSCVVIDGEELLLRTADRLYCVRAD